MADSGPGSVCVLPLRLRCLWLPLRRCTMPHPAAVVVVVVVVLCRRSLCRCGARAPHIHPTHCVRSPARARHSIRPRHARHSAAGGAFRTRRHAESPGIIVKHGFLRERASRRPTAAPAMSMLRSEGRCFVAFSVQFDVYIGVQKESVSFEELSNSGVRHSLHMSLARRTESGFFARFLCLHCARDCLCGRAGVIALLHSRISDASPPECDSGPVLRHKVAHSVLDVGAAVRRWLSLGLLWLIPHASGLRGAGWRYRHGFRCVGLYLRVDGC